MAAGGISLTPDTHLAAQSVTPLVIVVCEGQTEGDGAFLSQRSGAFSGFFFCGGSDGNRVGMYEEIGISDPSDFPIDVQLFIGDKDDFPNLKFGVIK